MFLHFGDDLLIAQFCIYSKRPPPPPSYFKGSGHYHQATHKLTKFCTYSKRPPPTPKKAVTTTDEPTE